MAINKNFVIKNGLEVNTNLIVADADNGKIGIGTTTITDTFHVKGGIGVTNLNVTGVATIANLRVTGPSTFVGFATFSDDVSVRNDLFVGGVQIFAGGGGGSSIGTDVVIERNLAVGGMATVTAGTLKIGTAASTGTANQILQVTGVSSDVFIGGKVGIGSTNPVAKLAVVGNAHVSGALTVGGNLDVTGDITYDEVSGRNINITGVSTFNVTRPATLIVSGVSTFSDNIDANADIDVDGHTELDNLNVSGFSTFASPVDINSNVHVSGTLTATTFEGTGKVIGIGSEGTAIGTGVSFIDFRSSTGTAFSCQPTVNGIATVTVTPGASIGLVIALGG
ncbi:tail fiber [Synechococcus phage SynMITS9220M01]|nr:tail fiber [Synechococcus phage SynMITS9220M01]